MAGAWSVLVRWRSSPNIDHPHLVASCHSQASSSKRPSRVATSSSCGVSRRDYLAQHFAKRFARGQLPLTV